MRNRVLFIIFACSLLLTMQLAALEPEDVLRNMPAPEINYPVNEIRVITPPALMPALPADAVDHPPEKPSYEARKLLSDIQKQASSPVINSTRKLLGNLARPAVVKKNSSNTRLASSSENLSVSSTTALIAGKKASRPQALLIATSTRILAAINTLASNPALLELRKGIESDSVLAGDIFALYLEQPQSQESTEKTEEIKTDSYDSVLATAIGMYKKSQWQDLKNLFADNPEAGETPDGLKYQVEAELNSEKPNYLAAKRFADRLLEADKNDPLGNYAVALFFYNSKKPNLVKAQQALDIALKAKKPPEGATNLYWTITLKKFAIPLFALIAGIIAGITQIIKKRKAANAISIESGDLKETVLAQNIEEAMQTISAPSGFKAKLQQLKDKFLPLINKLRRKKPEKQSEITLELTDSDSQVGKTEKEGDKQPETHPESKDITPTSIDAKKTRGEAERPPSEEIKETKKIVEKTENIEKKVETKNTEDGIEYEKLVVEESEEAEDCVEYEEVEVEETEEAEDGVEYEEVEVEETEEAEDGVEYEEVVVEEAEDGVEYEEVEIEEAEDGVEYEEVEVEETEETEDGVEYEIVEVEELEEVENPQQKP